MSSKRTSKQARRAKRADKKRKQRDKVQKMKNQTREEIHAFLVKNRHQPGRFDPTRSTPPDQYMETVMSDPVPENEWHDDDRGYILDSLKNAPESCSVKRRPDGTLCVMSNPVFEPSW